MNHPNEQRKIAPNTLGNSGVHHPYVAQFKWSDDVMVQVPAQATEQAAHILRSQVITVGEIKGSFAPIPVPSESRFRRKSAAIA